MGENTCGNFWELLGIPKNSNFEGELPFKLVGIFENPKKISELFMGIPKHSKNLKSVWLNVLQMFNLSHTKDDFK